MTAVETSRKSARTSDFVTSSSRRTLPLNKDRITANASELQTPQTTGTGQVSPFSPRLGGSLFTASRCPTEEVPQTVTPSSSSYGTPTPSRFKGVGGDDLVRHVFGLLQDANIQLDTRTERDLSNLLSKHAKTAEGLKRGRDMTRTTIKAREAKITELTYRIGTLEAELEAEKAVVKHLQWKVQTDEWSNT